MAQYYILLEHSLQHSTDKRHIAQNWSEITWKNLSSKLTVEVCVITLIFIVLSVVPVYIRARQGASEYTA